MTVIALGAGYAETCKSGSGGGSAETAAETQYGAVVPTSHVLRHWAFNLLKNETSLKGSFSDKQFKCLLDESFLDKVLRCALCS